MDNLWTWQQYETAHPATAVALRGWMEKTGLAYCATVDRDGRPRVAPVSPQIIEGEFVLMLIPDTPKASDLLQRPWCYLHLPLTRSGKEYAILGRVRQPSDPQARLLRALIDAEESGVNADDDLLLVVAIAKVVLVEHERTDEGDLHATRRVLRP